MLAGNQIEIKTEQSRAKAIKVLDLERESVGAYYCVWQGEGGWIHHSQKSLSSTNVVKSRLTHAPCRQSTLLLQNVHHVARRVVISIRVTNAIW